MKIICLTEREPKIGDCRKVYIAVDKIIEFYAVSEYSKQLGTTIRLIDRNYWTVNETPNEILEKIKNEFYF